MPAAKVLSKEVSPWQKDLQGTYLKGERVCTGILCACSQVHVSCLWTRVCDLPSFEVRQVQAESVLLAVRERHRSAGHWISVLPQHRSRWVTGVSSFDDRDWCQTPTELVWGSIMLSSPFLFAVFFCSLFSGFLWSETLENVEGNLEGFCLIHCMCGFTSAGQTAGLWEMVIIS